MGRLPGPLGIMSDFPLEWLRLREPFDLAARSSELALEFAAALRRCTSRPVRLLDLASGSGASFRALAPVIAIEQCWTMTDRDDTLLDAQQAEIDRWRTASGLAGDSAQVRWQVQRQRIDLAQQLGEIDLAAYDAITTSAFLDLVSAPWLDRFAAMLSASYRPLLAALSVDGRRSWQPALPDDEEVLAAFECHQSGDKGFGPALGTTAAPVLADRLQQTGFAVRLARSDWHIGSHEARMLQPLLEDTQRAACEARPDRAHRYARWAETRRRQLAAGDLELVVGHLDLLALPARPTGMPP